MVPCDPTQLVNAITKANGDGSAVLLLAQGCNYVLTTAAVAGDGLPAVTGNITLIGGPGTQISRDPTAPDFSAASQGGGIVNGGAMVLSGDRVTFNQASVNSGGILSLSPGTGSLRFTRVAFSTPDNCNPQVAIAGCRN